MLLKNLLTDFLHVVFPNNCICCGRSLVKGERYVCLHCLNEIHPTNYAKTESNKVSERFIGKVDVENACALYFFEPKSKIRTLIHHLKYKGNSGIGIYLGEKLGQKLISSPYYQDIDYIVPVPLHWRRKLKRGYNQSEMIATGIENVTGWKVKKECLYRRKYNKTQTHKNMQERWENTRDIFAVKHSEHIEGKHILLVDDVLTTGATLESCAKALKSAAKVKVSIATLACVWR